MNWTEERLAEYVARTGLQPSVTEGETRTQKRRRQRKQAQTASRPPRWRERELLLVHQLRVEGLEVEESYRWHPTRKYESEIHIAHTRFLVEINGKVHQVHADKFARDQERFREAVSLGWLVLPYLPSDVDSGEACRDIVRRVRGGS